MILSSKDFEHLMTILIYNTCEYFVLTLHNRRVLQWYCYNSSAILTSAYF